MEVFGIFRKPLPKEPYDNPKVRGSYRKLAESVVKRLLWFTKRGYEITAVIGAEGSPTCGIGYVGRWRDPAKKGRFPEDVVFVEGMGVFMEELKKTLEERGVQTRWIGIPGKSIKTVNPSAFEETLRKLEDVL